MAKYINKDEAYGIVLHYGSYAASAKIADLEGIELIRCGECKYTDDDGCGAIYCQMWDGWEMPEDAYCYLGERKDAE